MSLRDFLKVPDTLTAKEKALALFKALAWFAMLKSTDPEKQKALDRLQELRIEVQNILDVLAPGWEK